MATSITITLPDEAARAIAAAFDRQADAQAACQQFAAIAVDHFAGWIAGTRRYRSLSEMYAAWTEDLYRQLLPNEAPSFGRLYNSLNMPHGQATYIARTLGDRALTQWRQIALKDLKADVDIAWPTAQAYLKKGEKTSTVALRTGKQSARELTAIADRLWHADKTFVPPAPRGSAGDQRNFEVAAESLRLIRDALRTAP